MGYPRITDVIVWPVDIPLTDAFVISTGRVTRVENAFVAVRLDDGSVGYGELAPFTALTGETRDSSVSVAMAIGGSIGGVRIDEFIAAGGAIDAPQGEPAARAGVECAVIDAWCRSTGVPVWRYWGARAAHSYETDITIPILEDERVDELAARWYARGFRIFKLKMGIDIDDDIARLTRIAGRHRDVSFVLDANQGFDRAQAARLLDCLHPIEDRVRLLEQPLARDDLEGMAAIRRQCGIPLAADESVFTLEDARRVIDAGAADCINLKIMKSGLLETLRIAALAREHGVDLMVGGMIETRLAMSFSLGLAMGVGGVGHVDLDTPLLLAEDPVTGGFSYDGPRMSVWNDAGVGVVPREIPPF